MDEEEDNNDVVGKQVVYEEQQEEQDAVQESSNEEEGQKKHADKNFTHKKGLTCHLFHLRMTAWIVARDKGRLKRQWMQNWLKRRWRQNWRQWLRSWSAVPDKVQGILKTTQIQSNAMSLSCQLIENGITVCGMSIAESSMQKREKQVASWVALLMVSKVDVVGCT